MSEVVQLLPGPSSDEAGHHVQLDWIFRQRASRATSESARAVIGINALNFYKRFIKETANYDPLLEADPRFYLAQYWDEMALLKVKQYLETTNISGEEGYISSSWATNLMSAIRQVMDYAYEHHYINRPVINVLMPKPVRETQVRTAYSNAEYDAIFSALAADLRSVRGLLSKNERGEYVRKSYLRTGLGKDPRLMTRKGAPQRSGGKTLGEGWTCWRLEAGEYKPSLDNMRWYFENVMGCQALEPTRENYKAHNGFFHAAKAYHGGIERVYHAFGVTPLLDLDLLLPLFTELAAQTGLNVESMLSLNRDCLQTDTLTGMPVIIYDKERSRGDGMMLPINTFDPKNERSGDRRAQQQQGQDDPGYKPLTPLQSQVIARVIQQIHALTAPLADDAPDNMKDGLFLYQSRSPGTRREIRRLSVKDVNRWTDAFAHRHKLTGDDGKPLVFTHSRFRPTKFTQMVNEGYDLLDIFIAAGHSSITTTLAYVDRLKTLDQFQKTISKELATIRNNHRVFKIQPLPVPTSQDARPGEHVFKGPVCLCKNPYDPPAAVKRSGKWREGDSCTYFNMCLRCENVLITEHNLPKLFAYRREVATALQNGAADLPRQGELYKRILSILNIILKADGDDAIFTQEQLEWARQLSEVNEYDVIDAFTFQGGL